MKKAFIFGTLLAACACLFALDAEVVGLEGKAQVSANGTSWSPISVGSKISQGSTIQTGFKSSLQLKFKGSLITLDPMTRIKIDELSDKDNTDNAVVSMKIGGLTSNVKKIEDRRAGFTVKGPAATASVRGTIVAEEVGYNRDTVRAIENTTMVWPSSENSDGGSDNAAAGARAIAAGQKSSVDSSGGQGSPMSHAAKDALTMGGAPTSAASAEAVASGDAGASAANDSFASSSGSGSSTPVASKGSVVVTVDFKD